MYFSDPDPGPPHEGEKKTYTSNSHKLALLNVNGDVLAKSPSVESAIRTAKAMFDIDQSQEKDDGTIALLEKGVLRATITTKWRAEHPNQKPYRRKVAP